MLKSLASSERATVKKNRRRVADPTLHLDSTGCPAQAALGRGFLFVAAPAPSHHGSRSPDALVRADRFMGMKLPIDRVRGRSLDCLRDLAHSSRASRLESLNLKPQHMVDDEVSARLTRFGSPESHAHATLRVSNRFAVILHFSFWPR